MPALRFTRAERWMRLARLLVPSLGTQNSAKRSFVRGVIPNRQSDPEAAPVPINQELSQSIVASVSPGLLPRNGWVIRLTARSSTSKDNLNLAGSAVRGDGTWSPQSAVPMACVNGDFKVLLLPGERRAADH